MGFLTLISLSSESEISRNIQISMYQLLLNRRCKKTLAQENHCNLTLEMTWITHWLDESRSQKIPGLRGIHSLLTLVLEIKTSRVSEYFIYKGL